eukprot:CAMPEP_0114573202 /NCGR_PEP_ID=MMETSP0114-20121206/18737_1 /TAXON_ID=31324 /ORGANISM="Goniomonas sp, Strain m" /LENGTH=145 /DNA_ID=CAMNT_0001760539 /DNA_START=558 /DNA_END=995 /DNA_ORIENTATION=+
MLVIGPRSEKCGAFWDGGETSNQKGEEYIAITFTATPIGEDLRTSALEIGRGGRNTMSSVTIGGHVKTTRRARNFLVGVRTSTSSEFHLSMRDTGEQRKIVPSFSQEAIPAATDPTPPLTLYFCAPFGPSSHASTPPFVWRKARK